MSAGAGQQLCLSAAQGNLSRRNRGLSGSWIGRREARVGLDSVGEVTGDCGHDGVGVLTKRTVWMEEAVERGWWWGREERDLTARKNTRRRCAAERRGKKGPATAEQSRSGQIRGEQSGSAQARWPYGGPVARPTSGMRPPRGVGAASGYYFALYRCTTGAFCCSFCFLWVQLSRLRTWRVWLFTGSPAEGPRASTVCDETPPLWLLMAPAGALPRPLA